MSNVDIHTFCGTRRSWWRQYADTVDEHDLEGVHMYIYVYYVYINVPVSWSQTYLSMDHSQNCRYSILVLPYVHLCNLGHVIMFVRVCLLYMCDWVYVLVFTWCCIPHVLFYVLFG